MSSLKTLTLHSHASGPNPWKVAMIMEELGVPYEHRFISFEDMKKPAYEKVNPNGRVPTIEDPNTGLRIFESGAIIAYLVDQYDKDKKLQGTTLDEKYAAKSWADFQISGQGPYFGQMVWFRVYHPEKVQSAIDRYDNEAYRVVGVLDSHLKKQGTTYLTGEKVTYADIMFVPWTYTFDDRWPGEFDFSKYPTYNKWIETLLARPAVKKIWEEWAVARKNAHP